MMKRLQRWRTFSTILVRKMRALGSIQGTMDKTEEIDYGCGNWTKGRQNSGRSWMNVVANIQNSRSLRERENFFSKWEWWCLRLIKRKVPKTFHIMVDWGADRVWRKRRGRGEGGVFRSWEKGAGVKEEAGWAESRTRISGKNRRRSNRTWTEEAAPGTQWEKFDEEEENWKNLEEHKATVYKETMKAQDNAFSWGPIVGRRREEDSEKTSWDELINEGMEEPKVHDYRKGPHVESRTATPLPTSTSS